MKYIKWLQDNIIIIIIILVFIIFVLLILGYSKIENTCDKEKSLCGKEICMYENWKSPNNERDVIYCYVNNKLKQSINDEGIR